MDTQYDVIIIGSGESGKAAVKALQMQGKSALLIDLKPEMVTTMVCHTPVQSSQTSHPSSHISEPIAIGDEHLQILLHQQVLNTGTNTTITYTLQVQQIEEAEPVTTIETDPVPVYQSEEETVVDVEPKASKPDRGLLEPKRLFAEVAASLASTNHTLMKEREQSIKEKLIHRKTKSTFDDQPFDNQPFTEEMKQPIYEIERIQLEEESSPQENWSLGKATYFVEPEHQEGLSSPNSVSEVEPPVYREREMKLRKRLIGSNHRLQPAESPVPSARIEPEKPKTDTAQPFPMFQMSSNYLVQPPHQFHPPQAEDQPFPSNAGKNPTASEEKRTEVYPLEPFSSRRRNRSNKKSRFVHHVEPLAENPSRQLPISKQKGPSAPNPGFNQIPSFGSVLFENGAPTIQPFQKGVTPIESEPQQNENLKSDTIEFEDAYGGYNSWEDFLTPFSQNSRKRQGMDQIEKRKIALRGLHNLINNLG